MPATTVRVLLAHYKWNSKQLIEEYFESDDYQTFFNNAHVINPFEEVQASNFNLSEKEECKICYMDVSGNVNRIFCFGCSIIRIYLFSIS